MTNIHLDECKGTMTFEEYEREMTKPVPDLPDPHCETLGELAEWAKEHGCMNIVYHRNFARLTANHNKRRDQSNGRK